MENNPHALDTADLEGIRDETARRFAAAAAGADDGPRIKLWWDETSEPPMDDGRLLGVR